MNVITLALCLFTGLTTSHRRVTTEDGAALALYRYEMQASSDVPVLIIPDIGFGRPLVDRLARALAASGRVVYVAELRGQGRADAGASFRTWVHLDLPAISHAIGAQSLDLVAHGWAGALAMAASAHELHVRKIIALAVPYAPTTPVLELEGLLSTGRPFSHFSTSPAGAESFDRLFLLGSPVAEADLHWVRASMRDPSQSVSQEWLAWQRAGDLPLDDGTSVKARLQNLEAPILAVLALGDNVVGSETALPLKGATRGAVTVRSFSRFIDGDDFSHVSLLIGKNAERLVFPALVAFLEAP